MATVPAVSRVEYPLLPMMSADGSPMPADASTKLQRSLETVFPDMLVHGTHSTLLGMTTSLTRVGSQTHQYFTRVSQILAFERMMRSMMRLTAAMSPFPVDFGAATGWTSMFMPQQPRIPSPWALPAPQAKPAAALPFLAAFQPPAAMPQPLSAANLFGTAFQPQAAAPAKASAWPDYSELMIVPMALIMAAASADQMWRKPF
jgi:hypothetical protein